jgi:hypothetical protein
LAVRSIDRSQFDGKCRVFKLIHIPFHSQYSLY